MKNTPPHSNDSKCVENISVEKQQEYLAPKDLVEFFQKSQELYSYLGDDLSKQVFEQRMLYNTTNSVEHTKGLGALRIVEEDPKYNFDVINHEFQAEEIVVIYGAGKIGSLVYEYLKDRNMKELVFCDRYYQQLKGKMDIPVISPEELANRYADATVVIASTSFIDEIMDCLLSHNIPKSHILWGNYWDVDGQYFDEVVKLHKNEVFVDCGVLDGGSSILFSEKVNKEYKHIYLFEPQSFFSQNAADNLREHDISNFTMYNMGVWHQEEILTFYETLAEGEFSAVIGAHAVKEIKMPVNKMDYFFKETPLDDLPTFIKMDIEGAELNALKGAAETIQKSKPKLAICIYHKPEDIIEILDYIKFLVPEYKLYLRHYTLTDYETVVYAICD